MTRYIRSLIIVMCVLAAIGRALPVDAATNNLLRQSDAPPGFGKLHTKVYTHWVKKLKVATTTAGLGNGTNSCNVLPAFKVDGWKQGVIQAFDSPGMLQDFELCAHDFSTSAGAQRAYATARNDLRKHASATSGMKPMPGAPIGDQSTGIYGAQQGFVNAELIFRHGAVLVELLYLGSNKFSGAAFLGTARRTNARIP